MWGCLLYASNEPGEAVFPARLSRYGKRLEVETGFSHLQTLGENQTQLTPGRAGALAFPGNLRVAVNSVTHDDAGQMLVALQLFRDDKELLLTQAKLSHGSPLFIRGPAWRQGELIIAVIFDL